MQNEGISIINNKRNSDFLTPTQLRNYIKSAQTTRDEHAISALCTAFTPLILKEATRSYVLSIIGEDAVNIAWEIFLDFIYSYEGNKYRLLPGLIALNLKRRFIDIIYRSGNKPEIESLDACEDGDNLVKDEHNYYAEAEDRADMLALINKLTDKQKQLVKEVILGDRDIKDYCQENNISLQAAYKTRAAALKNLRNLLTE